MEPGRIRGGPTGRRDRHRNVESGTGRLMERLLRWWSVVGCSCQAHRVLSSVMFGAVVACCQVSAMCVLLIFILVRCQVLCLVCSLYMLYMLYQSICAVYITILWSACCPVGQWTGRAVGDALPSSPRNPIRVGSLLCHRATYAECETKHGACLTQYQEPEGTP